MWHSLRRIGPAFSPSFFLFAMTWGTLLIHHPDLFEEPRGKLRGMRSLLRFNFSDSVNFAMIPKKCGKIGWRVLNIMYQFPGLYSLLSTIHRPLKPVIDVFTLGKRNPCLQANVNRGPEKNGLIRVQLFTANLKIQPNICFVTAVCAMHLGF
jgi:hypothetical protein